MMSSMHPGSPSGYVIRKVPFREISERVARIDNRDTTLTLIRLFIRYLTRLVGYRVAAKTLSLILQVPTWGGTSRKMRYIRYLLETNTIRLEYLYCLSSNDLHAATHKKNRWAEITAKDSMSARSRWSAEAYLSLLSRHGHYGGTYDMRPTHPQKTSGTRFYIYGPNASSKPSSGYKDCVLVVTKPIDVDVSAYNGSMLFINSAYYTNVVCQNTSIKHDIINKYGEVYVSCRESRVSKPFRRARFPIGSQIAGPQGLGRILYHLMSRYGTFSCVIEGFDLFLESTAFGSYYPTLIRDKTGRLSEQAICCSLADHDALYNFLYIKEMAAALDIVDSVKFKSIMGLSGRTYLDELSRVRDFACLRSV